MFFFERSMPGTKHPRMPARMQHALAQIAEQYIEDRSIFEGGATPPVGRVSVLNTTASTITQYSPVMITDPAILPEDNHLDFLQRVVFEAVAPIPGSLFAVTQEAIAADAIGEAILAGVTHGRVHYGAAVGDTLDVENGSFHFEKGPGAGVLLWIDTPTTTALDGSITAAQTTINVNHNLEHLPTPFVIQIGTEEIEVTDVNIKELTVSRGYNATIAATHANGATVNYIDGALWGIILVCCGSDTTEEITQNITNSTTNTQTNFQNFILQTTGTPAADFGIKQTWKMDDTTTEQQPSAYDIVKWTDPAHAAVTSVRDFWQSLDGTMVKVLTIGGDYSEFYYPLRTDSLIVQGNLAYSSISSPSQITSNQNDYTIGTDTLTLRISTDAVRTITGFNANGYTGAAVDGRVLVVHNIGSYAIILANQSASSSAANRFLFGFDLYIAPNSSATLIYDGTSQRWRLQDGGPAYYGTYTPTLTGDTNITSSSAVTCQFLVVGNVVTVSGKVTSTHTTDSTTSRIRISLPIASNFTAEEECGGTASNGHDVMCKIYADATNDCAAMEYYPPTATSNKYNFSFTYRIL